MVKPKCGKSGDVDDFTITAGHYTLRVEQMGKNIWWWRVYFKEETVADAYESGELKKTARGAERKATIEMKKHFNQRQIT